MPFLSCHCSAYELPVRMTRAAGIQRMLQIRAVIETVESSAEPAVPKQKKRAGKKTCWRRIRVGEILAETRPGACRANR